MLSNLIDRIKLPFRKEKELYSSLHAILGFYPHDISYYKLALMHKSVMRRNAKGRPVNNERLEFLGDAILDAIVGDIVYRHFPGKREGFLTNTRSKLVQRETLNRLAKEMGITRLVLSNGRSSSHNSYMGGNAFEALVGAIYLDKGYEACMHFMQKRILGQLVNIDKVAYKEVNFKSKLIEWSQKNRVNLNFENIAETTDQGGSPVFQYKIVIEGLEGCAGKGYSKKESQQMACKLTLEKLRKEPQFIDAIFAAKTNRTKMEEEPVENVPTTEPSESFMITGDETTAPATQEASADDTQAAANDTQTAEKPAAKGKRRRRSPMYKAKETPEEAQQTEAQTATNVPKQADKTDEQVNKTVDQRADNTAPSPDETGDDDFDLSDISARKQSREEIIEAAEAAAFGE
ncbi:MAG: ribonuclease III [Prevotella sp.]|nr:ribonuclease III [Prevotella sp.]MBF1584567.1 ribonuclease III [Prevotella sp.]